MKKSKILVVDDDQDMRIFISALLKDGGFKPIIAGSTEEGLLKAEQDEPELIILDVPMPEKKGIHMYHNLKQDEKLKNIPVIMISTLEQQTLLQYRKSIESFNGRDISEPEAYLKKPVEAEDLLARVREIVADSKKKSINTEIV